ncbi:hypothetical protein FY047_14585 [Leclercia adecarboxylata]|uniref:hypothetical protein n=1 Tax=Leclercia adecarboxylata TaxID=83655 RepID=UPI0013E06836|nr:hypothetical protein [Leclercia adecarboxylata]QIG33840.1 hypothetical protein FY047_14585 [Leclercia adecarboxylata]
MYIHERRYQLVSIQGRKKYDLRLYRGIIEKVISATFCQGSAIADVHRDYFILLAEHQLPVLPVGHLVNMGKYLARQLPDVTSDAVKIYKVRSRNDSKQLFRCFSATVL